MRNIFLMTSVAAGAAVLMTATAARADVITNGSFEASIPDAPGWQATGAASVGSSGSNLATDGIRVGVLGVGVSPFDAASGTVFQDFAVSEAGTFHYGFDAGTVFFGGLGFAVDFTFRIDDQVLFTGVPTFVGDSVAFSNSTLSTRIEGDLDLTAGPHRFAFDIARPGTLFGRGVTFVIDDVESSFEPAAVGAVPEPSAWALLIFGFGAVGAGLRRKRLAALAFA